MGFPHSEIFGSKCAGNSPKLIAACHVLHRLLMPRHSPCALSNLTQISESLLRSDPKVRPATTSLMRDFKETKRSSEGGGKRDRTADLLLAKQALSQLSYAPV